MTPFRSALVLVASLVAVTTLHAQSRGNVTERVFVSAGRIEMQLGGGSYSIRPAADITSNATRANLAVLETPGDNFQATIEVPRVSDLIVRLSGGNLVLSGITGNKDIDSVAGNAEISVGNANDYASVEASVKAGDFVDDRHWPSGIALLEIASGDERQSENTEIARRHKDELRLPRHLLAFTVQPYTGLQV